MIMVWLFNEIGNMFEILSVVLALPSALAADLANLNHYIAQYWYGEDEEEDNNDNNNA